MLEFCTDESIENIIDRYSKLIFGLALTHAGNKTDAEDIFQDVFMAYHSSKRVFNDEMHRKAWFIRVTLNLSKKAAASSWKRKVVLTEEIKTEVFRFDTEEQNLIYDALCKLTQKYRTVLHLAYFEEMTVAEISNVTGTRTGTVKVQLTRGRNLMREMLKGDYFND